MYYIEERGRGGEGGGGGGLRVIIQEGRNESRKWMQETQKEREEGGSVLTKSED